MRTVHFLSLMSLLRSVQLSHDPEWVTAPETGLYEDLTEYTLYEKELTWNDASRICSQTNGHMISINSMEVFDLIEEFKLKEWILLQSKDFWSGLTEPNQAMYIWNNCTQLSTFHKLKGESYNDNELCYMVRHDSLLWESKQCSDKRYFVCEYKLPGGCDNPTILTSNKVATFYNLSKSDCELDCSMRSTCWSGISTNGGICILLESRSGNEALTGVTMFKKSCARVSVVPNAEVPVLSEENKSNVPLLNCSFLPSNSMPPITPSTPQLVSSSTSIYDISPTPCFVYETLSITDIYNSTNTINETQYIVLTETLQVSVDITYTINITETLNITDYIYITSTLIETSTSSLMNYFSVASVVTSTTTMTVNVTDIYNYTSTLYDSSCSTTRSNGTFFLSTNDPELLEIIASRSKELTVDKKSTNSYIRALTSARDDRPSSRIIGSTGIVFLLVPILIIIAADMPSVIQFWRKRFTKYRFKENRK